jgi:hypothetical protein
MTNVTAHGTGQPEWSVAIFSAREDATTLHASLKAAVVAVGATRSVVDVLINGNDRLAAAMAGAGVSWARAPAVCVRIWNISLSDKANAWNQYVEHIWPGSRAAFFVDGYASVAPDAFQRLSTSLDHAGPALAAAAVPSIGRSASELRTRMLKASQLHGSLYALKGSTVERLRTHGVKMPLGMYRVDAWLSSALNFNFDPGASDWNDDRITVVTDATWTRRAGSPWRPGDIVGHVRRACYQGMGRFEERALRDHLVVRGEAATRLPLKPAELVRSWARRNPWHAMALLARHPGALRALADVLWRRDWSEDAMRPSLLRRLHAG